jgi:hypothetical protein
MEVLLKMARHAGPLLKPHVPMLVSTLLTSLTTLEPQYFNYLSLHAAATQGLQEKVCLCNNERLLFCILFILETLIFQFLTCEVVFYRHKF